ncbi:hypothetical protein C8R46DRAFT_1237348 [Mycena filopes]|nr:hypothetical protein C8R46DRAFT_1237348 [Mycena filopes]
MPLLRHLTLCLDDVLPDTRIVLFREAPKLHSVRLNDTVVANLAIVQLPWAQLTSVTLSNVYPRECVVVLRQTPNLLHCDLGLIDEDAGPMELVTLLFLESLVLCYDSNTSSIVGYLDTLTLPALRNLTIPEIFLGENPNDALTRFINKSGCILEELCITDEMKDTSIYRQAFPLISTLVFNGQLSDNPSERILDFDML